MTKRRDSLVFTLFIARSGRVVYSAYILIMAPNEPKPLWKADDQQARLAELIASGKLAEILR